MKPNLSTISLPLLVATLISFSASVGFAGPRDDIVAALAAEAGVSQFSAAKGEAFFQGKHTGGKPEAPSCTTCHTNDPRATGQTRVGKLIEPMALSVTPGRFSDPKKVAKWFRRNCNTVLGRECTATEKGDVIAYLSSL